MTATIDTLLGLDDRLVSHGVPPLATWWRTELERWYRHPTALTLAACAGRGAAKSTALYKVALNETLFGDFAVPPGERHWASLTSRLKEEAAKGTDIISAWLRLLGVRHDPRDGVIELSDMPVGIRISAASVGGNTGWRSFFDGNDEVGKWPVEGALAVDAVEVLASKRAMTATHAKARHMLVSTPFIDSGPFFDVIHAGSGDHAIVAGPAPTWIATDGRISEEQTRRLEPNESIHAREYAARFAVEWTHGYFSGLIDACVTGWTYQPPSARQTYVVAIDPAFSRDLFAIAVSHVDQDGVVMVDRIEALKPERGAALIPTECLRAVKKIADAYGTREVLSDQFSAAALVDLAAREDLGLEPIAWTSSSKNERFEIVRTRMRDGTLQLPYDPDLRRELTGIGTRLLPSGVESIQARHGFTDDRVCAMVLAASEAAARAPLGGGSRGMSTGAGGRDRWAGYARGF